MSKELIDSVRLVEKYKNAIPVLERMVELGGCYYIAGTLCLADLKDPESGSSFTTIDIKDINDFESNIIKEAQYLASKIYVKHKAETCFSYEQAISNIKEYERIHGRDRSRQVQM